MLLVGILLGHHVLVSLQNYAGSIFVARSGGLGHYHIAHLVGFAGNVMAVGPAGQKLAHLVEMVSRTRHFGYFIEALPHKLRIEICNFHIRFVEGGGSNFFISNFGILIPLETFVGGCHARVITPACISRTVVGPRKTGPVFGPQIFHLTRVGYHGRKEFKLFQLRVTH